MEITLGKWGNSLAIRLPATMAKQLGIRDGSHVDLQLTGNKLIVQPIAPKPYRLAKMLESLAQSETEKEIPTGRAVGKERDWVWE